MQTNMRSWMQTAAAMKNVSVILLIVQIWISLQLLADAQDGEYSNVIELSCAHKSLSASVAASGSSEYLTALQLARIYSSLFQLYVTPPVALSQSSRDELLSKQIKSDHRWKVMHICLRIRNKSSNWIVPMITRTCMVHFTAFVRQFYVNWIAISPCGAIEMTFYHWQPWVGRLFPPTSDDN